MFDGMIQTLINMMYVLELRKKVISLCCLDTDGRRVTMSNEVLKFTKGSSLIMKEQKNKNLYMLQEHTVLNSIYLWDGYIEHFTLAYGVRLY